MLFAPAAKPLAQSHASLRTSFAGFFLLRTRFVCERDVAVAAPDESYAWRKEPTQERKKLLNEALQIFNERVR